jgi:hypothetical protein
LSSTELRRRIADAITYTVGPTAGNPIFDLRQDITNAWLDGVLFPTGQLAHHSFGTDPFTDLRIIQSVQSAGSPYRACNTRSPPPFPAGAATRR